MKDDAVLLQYILDALLEIDRHVAEGLVVLESRPVRSAVLYELQTLAETTMRLSQALKDRHPTIDWGGIHGFRNMLVHGYLGLDLEIIRGVIATDLAPLRDAIEVELARLGEAEL